MSAAQVGPQLVHQHVAAPAAPQRQQEQQQLQPAEPKAKQQQQGFEEEDPKAALKKGLEETEEQILFSCNICYDVSKTLGASITRCCCFAGLCCPPPLAPWLNTLPTRPPCCCSSPRSRW